MKPNKKLTDLERQAAIRIGHLLAEQTVLDRGSESDVDEILFWATEAIGLTKGHYIAFRWKVYKTVLERRPEYAERLTEPFRRKSWPVTSR